MTRDQIARFQFEATKPTQRRLDAPPLGTGTIAAPKS
jgi:hypothetical protein